LVSPSRNRMQALLVAPAGRGREVSDDASLQIAPGAAVGILRHGHGGLTCPSIATPTPSACKRR
jgi:hypothetical protein